MTKPSALVLDGSEVKLRLVAERIRTMAMVHLDWVRFTVIRRNAPFVPAEVLFPDVSLWDEGYREQQFRMVLRSIPDCDFDAAAQALDLARAACAAMGEDFEVVPEVRKGHDFYKFRWAIQRNGSECGWVGFLASGDSPRQSSQGRTLHCNLFGSACTFAAPGWNLRLATLIDERKGDLTRCDLALDFFDGMEGGMEGVLADYKAGLCDVGGRRLKCNMVGDWANGHERSFYFGSKEAGKQTNVYEKGDQLFGVEAGSPWLRIELRYGNKLRILSTDMLREPESFFAGASDWHSLMLARAGAVEVAPTPVRATPRLALETVEAEVTRNLRWSFNTAAPTMAVAFAYLGENFLELVTNKKLPGRLAKFSPAELARAFESAMSRFSTAGGAGPVLA